METQSSPTTLEPDADELPAPNLEVARGLREAADWLERHPELPRVAYASLTVGSSFDLKFPQARDVLRTLADALGEGATERRYRDEVSIEGRFGPVYVHGSARVRELSPTPPEPLYEPILPERES